MSPCPNPEISIIIPAYNAEETIIRSIEGILRPDIMKCELVVVNDGSSDNTREIVTQFIDQSGAGNIKLINQENKGLGGARNTGIINSSAPWLTFLDADDTLDLNVVKDATEKARQGNFDIVMFRFRRVGAQLNFVRHLRMLDCTGVEGVNQFFIEATSAGATARVYNKQFLNSANLSFPEKRYHEDLPFVAMAYYYAKNVSHINKIGYNWIIRDGSITSSVNTLHIDGIIDSLLEIKTFLKVENILEDTLSKFIVFCCKHLNGLVYKINTFYQGEHREKLFGYLKNRLNELDLNQYDYFLWKNFHMRRYIRYLNQAIPTK